MFDLFGWHRCCNRGSEACLDLVPVDTTPQLLVGVDVLIDRVAKQGYEDSLFRIMLVLGGCELQPLRDLVIQQPGELLAIIFVVLLGDFNEAVKVFVDGDDHKADESIVLRSIVKPRKSDRQEAILHKFAASQDHCPRCLNVFIARSGKETLLRLLH